MQNDPEVTWMPSTHKVDHVFEGFAPVENVDFDAIEKYR